MLFKDPITVERPHVPVSAISRGECQLWWKQIKPLLVKGVQQDEWSSPFGSDVRQLNLCVTLLSFLQESIFITFSKATLSENVSCF